MTTTPTTPASSTRRKTRSESEASYKSSSSAGLGTPRRKLRSESEASHKSSTSLAAAAKDVTKKTNSSSRRKRRSEASQKTDSSITPTPANTPAAAAAATTPMSGGGATTSSRKKRSESEASIKSLASATASTTPTSAKAAAIVLALAASSNTPEPPVVDVAVHRMRQVEYRPAAVATLRAQNGWLAVSRDNGSVELRHVEEKMRTIAMVTGFRKRPVHVLAWVCGSTNAAGQQEQATPSGGAAETMLPILVGGLENGSLAVVDFTACQLVGSVPSNGGSVLNLTSLCAGKCRAGTCPGMVAAGFEDGSVRIFQVHNNAKDRHSSKKKQPHQQRLELVSTTPSAGAPVLSVACHTQTSTATAGMTDMVASSLQACVLYAGVADGTIRRYTPSTIQSSSSNKTSWKADLRMTIESHGRTTPTRVWTLRCLMDGTLVSGDSLGHVQFWQGETGTLQQTFVQTDTMADVLDLAVTTDEAKVFASGVDSRVICLERRKDDEDEDDPMGLPQQWILTHVQRPHTHDVKALTMGIKRMNGKVLEILVSGGVDTKLCTYHVRDFDRRRPRTHYPWPASSLISVASEARLLCMQREAGVDIYRLANTMLKPAINRPVLVEEDNLMLGTVNVKDESNLAHTTLSSDGRFMAVSDTSSFLLFSLKAGTLDPKRLYVPWKNKSVVVAMRFIEVDLLVVATANDKIQLVAIKTNDEDGEFEASIVETFKGTQDEKTPSLPVHAIASTPDGQLFATLSNGLSSGGKIQVYSRKDDGKTEGTEHIWTLPNMGASPTAVAFVEENSKPFLAVACVNYAVYLFDIVERKLSKWSEEAGFPIASLPAELAQRADYPLRLSADPASPLKLLVGSFGAIVAVDTERKLGSQCRVFPDRHVRGKKRKRAMSFVEDGDSEEPASATVCLRYNSMLFMDFVGENEMVVVEQPWMSIVATFPEALQRKVYGA